MSSFRFLSALFSVGCFTLPQMSRQSLCSRGKNYSLHSNSYKINILNALKEQGLSSYRLRKENLLSEGAIQSLRTNKMISLDSVGRICGLLDCQPGDILAYKKRRKIGVTNSSRRSFLRRELFCPFSRPLQQGPGRFQFKQGALSVASGFLHRRHNGLKILQADRIGNGVVR